MDFIDKILDENEFKRANGIKKQQLLKIDIYELLDDKGFDISYSVV